MRVWIDSQGRKGWKKGLVELGFNEGDRVALIADYRLYYRLRRQY